MSNELDPDQDLCIHGPDLGPYCLQGYQLSTKVLLSRKELNAKQKFLLLVIFKTIHFDVSFCIWFDSLLPSQQLCSCWDG